MGWIGRMGGRGLMGQRGWMGKRAWIGRKGGTVVAVCLALCTLAAHARADVDRYEVYAVRFATIANFPVSSRVAGADRSRRMDIAMMIWVLKGVDGRIAIVDSGFHRDRYFTQFTVKDFIKPSEALAPLGIKADDVRKPRRSHRDRADARRGLQPSDSGSDEIAGGRGTAARPRPRSRGVHSFPARVRSHRPH
jgi:hypothetical protein